LYAGSPSASRALGLLLCLLLPAFTSAADPNEAHLSRYQRTVSALALAEDGWRGDFARVGLAQLAEVYLAESDLARREAQAPEPTDRAKLRGWSRAVAGYAEQLLLIIEDVELGFPVDMLASASGAPALRVGGRTVILNHPRADQQPAYEQQVLAQFCRLRDCDELTPPEVLEPIPVSAPAVPATWEFTEDGPVCEGAGISLRFPPGSNLGRARRLCTQLLQELTALELELRWQRRHGVEIAFDQLQVSQTPRGPEHLIRLNPQGDSTLLSVPLLYSSSGLLSSSAAWLTRRLASEPNATLSLEAADYGWLTGS
jgi:hypothetical protein